MLAIFETHGDTCHSRRWYLREGEHAKVGRTEWSDWSLPDPALSDIHFEVSCTPNECLLQALGGQAVQLNGESVTATTLASGDRIRAGETVFMVTLEGTVGDDRVETEESRRESSPRFTDSTVDELVIRAELQEAMRQEINGDSVEETINNLLADARQRREQLRTKLTAQERYQAVIQLLAFGLPADDCLRWLVTAYQQLGDRSLSDHERACWETGEHWVSAPDNVDQARIELLAAEAGHDTSAYWLVTAIAGIRDDADSLSVSKAFAAAATLLVVERGGKDILDRYELLIAGANIN